MVRGMTREEWLIQAAGRLAESGLFQASLPPVQVSIGWPLRKATGRNKAIGQCFATIAARDGKAHIFVSPVLEDPIEVLETLVHELVHAVVGVKCGHRGAFTRLIRAIGLEGKPTATHAGPDLRVKLEALASELGPFPHGSLSALERMKKQGTRMLKLTCPNCGYLVRTTRQWIEHGLPRCPCGSQFEEA